MKLIALALFAFAIAAQEPDFRGYSRLVTLPATVVDAQGRQVDGLTAQDFMVMDNGRVQKAAVDTIGTGVAPIALVIAVQSSGISAAVLEKVQKTAGLIQPLITGEKGCAALVAFSERVTWLQDCTSDADVLARAFKQLHAGEYRRARMLDATAEAAAYLSKRPNARRVLLLVSESRDRGSESELALVTAACQSAGITVYAATYSALKTGLTSRIPIRQQQPEIQPSRIPNPYRTWNGGPPSKYNPLIVPPADRLDILVGMGELVRLRKIDDTQILTGGTGGRTLPFTLQKGLEAAIQRLGAELHEQYVLSFVPEAAGAGYHVLEVRVVSTSGLRVRARPGYWGPGTSE